MQNQRVCLEHYKIPKYCQIMNKKAKDMRKKKIKRTILVVYMMFILCIITACQKEDPGFYIDPNNPSADKPVVYLYNFDGDVDVQLSFTDGASLACSYPQYVDKWHIRAFPNGLLLDKNGRQYRYLYYEAQIQPIDYPNGFCVKGEETAKFLEEKLHLFGLTDLESNDFITYWLPQMAENPYNVIRFVNEEYDQQVGLKVTPQADTQIRVFMNWYPSEKPVPIPKQVLNPISERHGRTVVEWGGCRSK